MHINVIICNWSTIPNVKKFKLNQYWELRKQKQKATSTSPSPTDQLGLRVP